MKPTAIILHHELGSNGFLSVNEYHRKLWNFKSSLGWFGGYQYYIDKLGNIHQFRRDDEEGAHTIGRNKDSIGICLEGDFDRYRPTNLQIIALKGLILQKMTYWAILPKNVYGHRIFANKSCPGNLWPESEIRALFQPDLKYYQVLINSLKDWISKIKLGKKERGCL